MGESLPHVEDSAKAIETYEKPAPKKQMQSARETFNRLLQFVSENSVYSPEIVKPCHPLQDATEQLEEMDTKKRMSDSSAEDEQQKKHESMKKPMYERTKNLFGEDMSLVGLPKEIIVARTDLSANKKRNIDMVVNKFIPKKPISEKIKKIYGSIKPIPLGVPNTSQWRIFFKAMEAVGSKMLWVHCKYDKVFRNIHIFLKSIMLQTYTRREMSESIFSI